MIPQSKSEDLKTLPETGPDTSRAARTEFFIVADRAKKEGLITQAEINVIYRPNTRKQNYWKRHLHDLNWLIEERKSKRDVSKP